MRGTMKCSRGFTLVELLVVVSIIVVLIALLTPSLDQAIYQAELVACAARQESVASATLTYAIGNRRRYPHRAGVHNDGNWLHMYICAWEIDDRQMLFSYLRPESLLDPFSGQIDLETQALQPIVYANYALWFGFTYKHPGERGMFKVGDRLTWTDRTASPWRQKSYTLLVSDDDFIRQNSCGNSHPDRGNTMEFARAQDDAAAAVFWGLQGRTLTLSYWRDQTTSRRTPTDANYAYDDGSVLRFSEVTWDEGDPANVDGRMDRLYEASNSNPNANLGYGRQVPRQ